MNKATLVGISVAIVMLLAITAGCVETDTVTDTFDGEYDATEDTELTVKNKNGDITITRYAGDIVDLHVLMVSRVSQDRLDQLEIVVTEEAGNIDIETTFSGNRDHPGVDMTIKVPNGVHVKKLETSNGDVTTAIDGTEGAVAVISSNGLIDVTVIGDMDHPLTLETSNGDIKAILEGDVNADLTLDTSNKNIELTVKADLNASITAETSNGDIVMRIGQDPNADFKATTSNGDVTLHELTVTYTVNDPTHKEGTLGTGGPMITLDSDNGDIDLYKYV